MRSVRSAPDWRWLVVVLLAGGALRLGALGELALFGDEAYYYLWGQHLDWSYYDHPAGVALLVRASTAVAGSSEFGIRWLNAITGLLSVAATAWLSREMLRPRAHVYAAALVALGAPFIITSRIVYTDALHILFALFSVGAYWRLLRHGGRRPRDGVVAGLSLAILVNTKYTAFLLAGALGLVTLLWHRQMLRRPALWLSVLIGALGLLPVVAWNTAHDYASFRWQLEHLVSPSPGGALGSALLGWLRNLRHALVYTTWPIALVASLGLGNVASPGRRILTCTALAVTVPVVLSPANSPRNLSTGLVFLLVLAADLAARWAVTGDTRRAGRRVAVAAGVLAVGVYGAGTAAALPSGLPWLPQSSGVALVRSDAAGRRAGAGAIRASGLDGDTVLVAVDYNVAGQLAYYTTVPVTTAWSQYRLWGIPPLGTATVVAGDYVSTELITSRLRDAYESVTGPRAVVLSDGVGERRLWVWELAGLTIAPDELLDSIDFLRLSGIDA